MRRGPTNTMETWIPYPPWQNFSSLFREATTALDAKTGMERSHHLTAALYFGLAALEAFLNEQMRKHLSPTQWDPSFHVSTAALSSHHETEPGWLPITASSHPSAHHGQEKGA